LVGALIAARRTVVSVDRVSAASVAYGASMVLMAISPSVPVTIVVAVLLGLSSISFLVASTAIVQTESAPEMRGRVLALQAMLFLGSTPVGGPIVGWVAEQFGARYSLALGAIAALLAGAWGFAVMRRARPEDAPVAVTDDERVGSVEVTAGAGLAPHAAEGPSPRMS
jgi:MFS family permease